MDRKLEGGKIHSSRPTLGPKVTVTFGDFRRFKFILPKFYGVFRRLKATLGPRAGLHLTLVDANFKEDLIVTL